MISVKSKPSAAGGFTLIELMIVVAIVAILAAIAIPGMRKYVERARHAEAAAALSSVQLDMERWRSENPEYPTVADHATAIPRNLDTPSYTIEVTASDAVSYSLEATIKDGIDDETCASMTIDYADGGTTRAPAACF